MKYFKSIAWGTFAAFGALIMELVVSLIFPKIQFQNDVFQSTNIFIISSAIIEEFCKIIIIAGTSRQFAEKRQIIFNSILIGIGFAMTESFFTWSNGIFSRNILFQGIPGLFFIHSLTALAIGSFIGHFRFNLSLWMLVWPFTCAVAFHLAYNLILLSRYRLEAITVFIVLSVINLPLLFLKRSRVAIDTAEIE